MKIPQHFCLSLLYVHHISLLLLLLEANKSTMRDEKKNQQLWEGGKPHIEKRECEGMKLNKMWQEFALIEKNDVFPSSTNAELLACVLFCFLENLR